MIPAEAVKAAAKEAGGAEQRPAPLEGDGPANPERLSWLHQQELDYQQIRVPSSSHVCATCGDPFTVIPAVPAEKLEQWVDCLGWHCSSYTPTRDPFLLGGITREDKR